MIRLSRGLAPQALLDNWKEWTEEWTASRHGGPQRSDEWAATRFGSEQVRQALARDSHGKCMYCEGRMADVSYPNVEHIRPKARFDDAVFDWDNLGVACAVCNTSKGAQYDPTLPPVDPYREAPGEFLRAVGWYYFNWPGSDRGRLTIAMVQLNRGDLVESRKRLFLRIAALLDGARSASGSIRDLLMHQVEEAMMEDAEFSSMCRQMTTDLSEPHELEGKHHGA